MNLDEMNLQQVEERIAVLDKEVREATKAEDVETRAEEKKSLLTRKSELEALEARKKTALDLTAGKANDYKTIEIMKGKDRMEFTGMHPTEVRATEEYRSAFYKSLLGRPLNEVEKRANEMGTTDVSGVIPTQSSSIIFDLVKQYAPLLGEVTLLNVPGPVKFGIENTNTAAALHTQNAAITPAADNLTYVQLNGFEIVKALRISKTVAAQAISAFETWLTDYLARGIAAKVGAYMIYGSGSSQPKGIDYMNTWADTTNAVQWAGAAPLAAELLEQVSYLKAGYHNGAKWLMNASTLWGKIAGQQDNSKFKILSDDYTRMLGYPILLDDNVAAGDVFFGNFRQGMVANFSQAIRVDRSSESGFLYNAFDFLGSTIFDCTTTHTEGFVKGAHTLTAGA